MPLSKQAIETIEAMAKFDFALLKKIKQERIRIASQMSRLRKRDSELAKESNAILHRYRSPKELTPDEVDALFANAWFMPLSSSMSLGDAVEALLRKEGPSFQKDIIEAIREAGIRLSEKAPYVVIGRIVKHDSKNRFKILKDGRVALRKENEKADAKG